MTVRFGNYRLAFYVCVFLLAGVVLGIGSHFANVFIPERHTAFSIFTIVVSASNIFVFLLTLQWSKPKLEAFVLFIIGVLWLALGAWTTDVIGHVQCDAIGDENIGTKNNSTISAISYCQEMKVVQAFSWALFALFILAFYILFQLVGQARKYGRHHIWKLPWFEEMPGYYNTHTSGHGIQYPQPGYPYPYPSSYPQSGGNAIMIQPGMNGAAPTITQVPMSAVPLSP